MSKEINIISRQLINIFENVIQIEKEMINREACKNLSMAEIHTIAAIGTEKFGSMSEIAGKLHITTGTLTVAINNLVNKKYVERYKSEKDRRIVNIGLTKQGKEICRIHEAFHHKLGTTLTHDMTEEEKGIVKKAMANLDGFIRRESLALDIVQK